MDWLVLRRSEVAGFQALSDNQGHGRTVLLSQQTILNMKRTPHSPEIEYLDEELTDEELASLYAACDCRVHPFRGEGFGVPMVEAMANGLAVIATATGPVFDYCSDETAFLVLARIVPFSSKRVGEHEIDNPKEARCRGQAAAQRIRPRFTWETVQAIEYRLEAIYAQPICRR